MSKVNEYLERINVLEKRTKSAKLTRLTAKQMKMYKEVESAYKNQPNAYLSRKELQALVASDLEDRDNFISDFVYNTVNKEDKPVKFMLKEGRKYTFVGTEYKPKQPIEVTWDMRISNPKKIVVAYYGSTGFVWDFKAAKEYLSEL